MLIIQKKKKKLNVDGSLNVVIPSAGVEGALRNENGDWEDGFHY